MSPTHTSDLCLNFDIGGRRTKARTATSSWCFSPTTRLLRPGALPSAHDSRQCFVVCEYSPCISAIHRDSRDRCTKSVQTSLSIEWLSIPSIHYIETTPARNLRCLPPSHLNPLVTSHAYRAITAKRRRAFLIIEGDDSV